MVDISVCNSVWRTPRKHASSVSEEEREGAARIVKLLNRWPLTRRRVSAMTIRTWTLQLLNAEPMYTPGAKTFASSYQDRDTDSWIATSWPSDGFDSHVTEYYSWTIAYRMIYLIRRHTPSIWVAILNFWMWVMWIANSLYYSGTTERSYRTHSERVQKLPHQIGNLWASGTSTYRKRRCSPFFVLQCL